MNEVFQFGLVHFKLLNERVKDARNDVLQGRFQHRNGLAQLVQLRFVQGTVGRALDRKIHLWFGNRVVERVVAVIHGHDGRFRRQGLLQQFTPPFGTEQINVVLLRFMVLDVLRFLFLFRFNQRVQVLVNRV